MQPWQMWGGDKQFELAPGQSLSQQTSSINYGRPETWSFLLGFRCTDASGPAVAATIDCAFDVVVGVGRSVIELRNFVTFQVNIPNVSNAAVGPLLWVTQTLSPQQIFPPSGNPLPVDYVVADSIQCSARCLVTAADPLVIVRATATSFFTPRAHVRPEWFKGGAYRGGENNGL